MNRIRFHLVGVALLAGAVVSVAQTGTPSARPQASSADPTSERNQQATGTAPTATAPPESTVPATTPVITIKGVCEISPNGVAKPPARTGPGAKPSLARGGSAAAASPASPSGDCKTQITRADFEKLLKTVAPPGTPATAYRQIATRYAQFLTAANEGVKMGVEKDPEFSEQLALMRLQLLAQDAERKIQKQASDVSDADAKTYYEQNPSAFEEVTLTRIFVPRGPEPAQGQTHPDSKAIAESARQQLAGGGDPDKIQKAVFEQLKNANEPPSTKFGVKRRGSLPPAQEQQIFALKPAEVSEVIPDAIGYVIYRVDSKQPLPLDQAKEEAKKKITQQRLDDARQHLLGAGNADYNDSYFGPESASPRMGPLGGGQPASRPQAPPPGSAPPANGSNQSPQSQPANPK